MNRININGVDFIGGRSISVVGGRVFIDGKDVTPDTKNISIAVEGNVEKLEVEACGSITVKGNVGSLSTTTGDVECGDVTGSVSSMSGDIVCENIGGSASTMSGDITHRRK